MTAVDDPAVADDTADERSLPTSDTPPPIIGQPATGKAAQVQGRLLDLAVELFDPLLARVTFTGELGGGFTLRRDQEMAADVAESIDELVLAPLAVSMAESPRRHPEIKQVSVESEKFLSVSVPVLAANGQVQVSFVLLLAGDCRDAELLRSPLKTLAATTSIVLTGYTRSDPKPQLDPPRAALAPPRAALSGQLTTGGTLRELGMSLTNQVCNDLRCELVGVGMVQDKHVHVLAMSGCPTFKPGNPGVAAMRQAMEECLDQDEAVAVPARHPEEATLPIHRRWSLDTAGSNVYSMLLRDDQETVGVISLRRPAGLPFRDDELAELTKELAPVGQLLNLSLRANRTLASHALADWRAAAARRREPIRRWGFGLLALFLLWLCFGRVTYRPLCESTVVSSQLQHLTAPFEARLERVHVRAGDQVKQGDLLVEFETYPLQLERETVQAEITKTEVDVRRAIEAGDASAAALHNAQIAVFLARTAALDRRIENASIRAPRDGMIVQSSLDKRMGQVFSQGQPLLEFAPHEGWAIEINVPEHVAMLVQPDQVGTFVSASAPDRKIPLRVKHVMGSAQVIDQQNVFLTHADLLEDPTWIRSGMQGVARIKTVRKPVCWVLFHRLIDWTRLRFWL